MERIRQMYLNYGKGFCYQSSILNQKRLNKMGVETRIVVGSQGFKKNLGVHWEYGFPESDTIFKKNYKKQSGLDAHIWLEDNEGRIYDSYSRNGESKGDLKNIGIHYKEIKCILLQRQVLNDFKEITGYSWGPVKKLIKSKTKSKTHCKCCNRDYVNIKKHLKTKKHLKNLKNGKDSIYKDDIILLGLDQ